MTKKNSFFGLVLFLGLLSSVPAFAGFYIAGRGGITFLNGDPTAGYTSKAPMLGGEAGIGLFDIIEVGGFYDSYLLSVDTTSTAAVAAAAQGAALSNQSVQSYGGLARVYLPSTGLYAEGRLGRGGGFGAGYRMMIVPMLVDLRPQVTYVTVAGSNFFTIALGLAVHLF